MRGRIDDKILQVTHKNFIIKVSFKKWQIVLLNAFQFLLKNGGVKIKQHILIAKNSQGGTVTDMTFKFFLIARFGLTATENNDQHAHKKQF